MKKSWFVVAAAIPLVAIGSIAVWELSGNDQRRLGSITSESAPVSLAWRGPWDAEARYVPGQVVSYQGSSYVAETETERTSPDPKECTGEDCPWATLGAKAEPGVASGGGLSKWQIVTARKTVQQFTGGHIQAQCPAGTKVVGGGGTLVGGYNASGFPASYPTYGGPFAQNADTGWEYTWLHHLAASAEIYLKAICVEG